MSLCLRGEKNDFTFDYFKVFTLFYKVEVKVFQADGEYHWSKKAANLIYYELHSYERLCNSGITGKQKALSVKVLVVPFI